MLASSSQLSSRYFPFSNFPTEENVDIEFPLFPYNAEEDLGFNPRYNGHNGDKQENSPENNSSLEDEFEELYFFTIIFDIVRIFDMEESSNCNINGNISSSTHLSLGTCLHYWNSHSNCRVRSMIREVLFVDCCMSDLLESHLKIYLDYYFQMFNLIGMGDDIKTDDKVDDHIIHTIFGTQDEDDHKSTTSGSISNIVSKNISLTFSQRILYILNKFIQITSISSKKDLGIIILDEFSWIVRRVFNSLIHNYNCKNKINRKMTISQIPNILMWVKDNFEEHLQFFPFLKDILCSHDFSDFYEINVGENIRNSQVSQTHKNFCKSTYMNPEYNQLFLDPIIAIKNSDDFTIKYSLTSWTPSLFCFSEEMRDQIMVQLIIRGDLKLFQYANDYNIFNWDNQYAFMQAAYYGKLNILEWMYRKYPYLLSNEQLCTNAALNGHFEMLKWLHDHHCPWNEDTCSFAALNNHLEILIWARQHQCPWNGLTCAFAAEHGHLRIIEWARSNGCPWDERTTLRAAFSKQYKILRWVVYNGCPLDNSICVIAAEYGNLNLLKWVRFHGCPWSKDVCAFAALNGHLDVLIWAHSNGCPWDSRVKEYASLNQHTNILEFLTNNGLINMNKYVI